LHTNKVDAQCNELVTGQCDRAKMTTFRVESRQFSATAPAFNLTYLHLGPPSGVTPF